MLRSKLNYKLILATISSLLLVAGIFFYFLYSYHKAQLTEGLITSTTNLSKLIQQGLEYAMVSRRGDLLKNMVYQLADGPEVSQIYILDRTGTIRVSSDEAQVGYTIDRNSHTCQLCHSKAPEKRSTTAIFRTANGSEVLRNVTPIFNKGECHGCHNPADRINGVLIMDFSMEKINAQLTQNVWTMLTMTGILVLVLAGVIGGYTNRLVFGRLKAVVKATKQVGAGDLSARVGLAGQDELAQLGQSFNQMASQLESSIDKLKTTQEYLKHLISSVDDGIVVVDRDLTVVMVNEAYLDIIGQPRENLLGSSCSNFCHQTNQPCDDTAKECTAQKTFDTGRLHKNIMTMPDDEGGERTLEIFSSPIRGADGSVDQVVEVVRDITERQRLEATRFAERGEDWEEAAEVAEYHELIRKEVSRCKRITDKLLLLARRAPSEARWVDLKTSVEETVSLVVLEAERRGVALEWSWTDDIPPVKADDGQLRQVLLNLLLNSIQATERGGSVKVRGSKRESDLAISVSDNGCGIPPSEIKLIFEPFYTNKPLGQGTGLGLFISKNIVMDHGGDIIVESQPGVGTTMTVVLPLEGPGQQEDLVPEPGERRHFG
jgi:PAS domain S-box-containing protein